MRIMLCCSEGGKLSRNTLLYMLTCERTRIELRAAINNMQQYGVASDFLKLIGD